MGIDQPVPFWRHHSRVSIPASASLATDPGRGYFQGKGSIEFRTVPAFPRFSGQPGPGPANPRSISCAA